jgi:hypothetical protein
LEGVVEAVACLDHLARISFLTLFQKTPFKPKVTSKLLRKIVRRIQVIIRISDI